jgi:hypothetical protein
LPKRLRFAQWDRPKPLNAMMKRSISKTTAKIAGAAADFGDNSEPGGYRILLAGIFRVHLFAVAQGKGLTHHSQLDNS